MLKTLFSYFVEQWIQYKQSNDFKLGNGTNVAVLNKQFLEISRERIYFGFTPNKSATDMVSLPKIVNAIKIGNLKPYDNFEHFRFYMV